MRKLWTIRWFRVLLGVVLTAALLAPVVLPALQMQRQEPENPIRKENIQPVRRLSFGDGDGGTLAAVYQDGRQIAVLDLRRETELTVTGPAGTNVIAVCGGEGDPQGKDKIKKQLREAGVIVAESNHESAMLSTAIMKKLEARNR